MAISHTTRLPWDGRFKQWMTAIVVAGVATMSFAIAGNGILGGEAAPAAAEPSIRNLLPGIDESFTGARPAEAVQPSLHKLFPGLDAGVAATSAAAAEAAAVGVAPHFLEGIDGSYRPAIGSVGPSAYTLWKLEQARGETVSADADSGTGPSDYTLFKVEQARGEAAASSPQVRPNLVEGL